LDFTVPNEKFTLAAILVQIVASLGLITALLACVKYYVDTWRWRRYKFRIHDWINGLIKLSDEERHPKRFQDQDWRVECERMLTSAYFSPIEIIDLLETSVIVAKGMAVDRGLLDYS
jgi:hypothetical protein